MKKYSIFVTIIALGLLAYILMGQPAIDMSSSRQAPSNYSASAYHPAAQSAVGQPTAKPTAKPTARPTARPTTKPTTKPTAKPTAKPAAKATVKPAAKKTAKPTVKPAAKTYILNKKSKVFHKPTCHSVKQMKDSNKRTYTGTRQGVIDMGYRPCGNCNP